MKTIAGKMAGLWRRIIALSDPQYTADFQRFCGVKPVDNQEQNGNCEPSVQFTNANDFPEECCEPQSVNGDAHPVQNGKVAYQNGSASLHKLSSGKQCELKNGFLSHRVVQNGGLDATHLNGTVSQCRVGTTAPSANGFVRNGDLPKTDNEDKTKNTKPKPYVIGSMMLYYIFSFGACLGNEIFYIFFFSFGLWTFDCGISRKISLIWCVIMYIGQASKDVICWPRPSSPPAIRLEGRYELEYGMPSTHAMVGVLIPFGMLYYTYGVYEVCTLTICTLKSVNVQLSIYFNIFFSVLEE